MVMRTGSEEAAGIRSMDSTSKATPAARRAVVTDSAGEEGSTAGNCKVIRYGTGARCGGGGLAGEAVGLGSGTEGALGVSGEPLVGLAAGDADGAAATGEGEASGGGEGWEKLRES
jgi:hypothetical protein